MQRRQTSKYESSISRFFWVLIPMLIKNTFAVAAFMIMFFTMNDEIPRLAEVTYS